MRWSILSLVLMVSVSAHAQVNQAGMARQLSSDAVAAARAGDWERAADLFQQAYDLAPRPLALYNLASAQRNIGRLVDADENFRRFLRETAPGEHDDFRAEAVAAREVLATQIAYAQVSVENMANDDVVRLDGVALTAALLGRSIPIDPGEHLGEVVRGDSVVASESITVDPGDTVQLNLVARPVAVDPEIVAEQAEQANATNAAIQQQVDEGDDDGGVHPAVWVTIAVVVAAGLAVGGYFLFREDDPDPFQGSVGTIDFR